MNIVKAMLNLIYQLFMAFPRFFSSIFWFAPILKTTIEFLPQVIEIVKGIINMSQIGYNKAQIQRRCESISNALQKTDRLEAARELRDALSFGDKE